MKPKIGLVYLNRKAEGNLPVQQFIDSYKAFAPGVDHELITIYKGFSNEELDRAKGRFKDVEHRNLTVDDNITDIDSYLFAVKSLPDIDVFCFLNTFSQVMSENWLSYLYNAISRADVGIAGATASYESLFNSVRLNTKVIWLAKSSFLKPDRSIYLQYKTIIEEGARAWAIKNFVNQLMARDNKPNLGYDYLDAYDARFEEYWNYLTSPGRVFEYLFGYPPFPNPHIRSNGFMIKSVHLLPYLNSSETMSKKTSYLFESGADGLTRRIQSKGLRTVVVNSRGRIFDVEEWPRSRTFRLGGQEDLLIRDNQTRKFEKLPQAEKDVLAYMTWGPVLKYSPGRIYTFNIPFGKNDNI
jgi:hypothetical protein